LNVGGCETGLRTRPSTPLLLTRLPLTKLPLTHLPLDQTPIDQVGPKSKNDESQT